MSGIINLINKIDQTISSIGGPKKINLIAKLKRNETLQDDNNNEDKRKQSRASLSPSDVYLKIDKQNTLSQIDEKEFLNLREKFKEFKEKESEKFESTNNIINKFLEKFSSRLDNMFLLSLNLSKNITKNIKIGHNEIEKKIN